MDERNPLNYNVEPAEEQPGDVQPVQEQPENIPPEQEPVQEQPENIQPDQEQTEVVQPQQEPAMKQPGDLHAAQTQANPYYGYYGAGQPYTTNPVPGGYYPPYGSAPGQPPYGYAPYPGPAPKKPKKNRMGLKIAALVVAVAILGTLGGVLVSAGIRHFKGEESIFSFRDEEETEGKQEGTTPDGGKEDTPAQPSATPESSDPEDSYVLVTDQHTLPDELPSNDAGKALTMSQVYEQTVNSVVGIQTESTTNIFGQEAVSASAGSGFILTEDGYVITNAHVVSGADTITVDLYNGESHEAVLVGSDSSFDIAVLKIEAEGLVPVSVGDSDTLKVGEEVAAIGNPLGELTFTMTSGILSALDREINTDGYPQNMLQTNAAINSGNSGGPLFDMNANVIGVTTAKYSGSTTSGTTIEGLGFAIPINTALKVAYDLVEYGYVKGQAYLGITVSTLDSRTAAYYSLPVGPRVESVTPGSCAEKAGMQVGDIVLEFNGTTVTTHPELLSALKKVQAGDTVDVTVYRSGTEVQLTVTLDEKPMQQETETQPEASEQEPDTPNDGYYFEFPFGFGG